MSLVFNEMRRAQNIRGPLALLDGGFLQVRSRQHKS